MIIKKGFRGKGKSLDRMTWMEFEGFLARLFESWGFKVETTQRSHDKGVDLFVTRFGKSIVVQAKCWKRHVGTKAIQQVFTAQQLYHSNNALVIITSEFTKPAIKLAEKLGVMLWNRKRLLDEIKNPLFDIF